MTVAVAAATVTVPAAVTVAVPVAVPVAIADLIHPVQGNMVQLALKRTINP